MDFAAVESDPFALLLPDRKESNIEIATTSLRTYEASRQV